MIMEKTAAYKLGQYDAYGQLGLYPGYTGLPPGYMGLYPFQGITAEPPEEKSRLWHIIRKAGPAIGALAGAALGVKGLPRGLNATQRLSHIGGRALAGTSIGWMPDVFSTAAEEI